MNPFKLEQERIQARSQHPQKLEGRNLEDFPLIKLLPGEKILCVQRQHWIVLLEKILPTAAVTAVMLTGLFLPFFQQSLVFLPNYYALQTYLILVILCVFLIIETYNFLSWFYQFYIITTRCIIHIHFFRIGGFFFEEVFLSQVHQQEISRHASSLFYDLLGLFDVSIYFNELERKEPFIFKTPRNSEAIENLLENLTVKEIDKREGKG